MKMKDINIRDPYVLLHENRYYMYGTRAATCWGKADGFDCYVSEDLEEWSGPYEVFCRSDDFWADQNFWAPECICYRDKIYMVTTLGNESRKGIQILCADTPLGPFETATDDVVTPGGWSCIDGTVFIDQGTPWLIFSHSFEDTPYGDMCMIRLSEDLRKTESGPVTLFSAQNAPWARPVPFAEQEFGLKGEVYLSDGPSVYRQRNGRLLIIWSSWGRKGYEVGIAVSDSGRIEGPWKHAKQAVFDQNGGHGMLFRSKDGKMYYILHHPNDQYQEHPVLLGVEDEGEDLVFNVLGSKECKK